MFQLCSWRIFCKFASLNLNLALLSNVNLKKKSKTPPMNTNRKKKQAGQKVRVAQVLFQMSAIMFSSSSKMASNVSGRGASGSGLVWISFGEGLDGDSVWS